jgi:hypothetical protein
VKPHRKPVVVVTEPGDDGFYDVDNGHVVGQCSLPDGTGIQISRAPRSVGG